MTDVALKVNGKAYVGWKTARVTRSIESVAGSFDLSVSDRWNDLDKPWPIRQGDECTIALGNTVVLTGYVDKREMSFDAQNHTLRVSGRDKTGDLVDCSAMLENWEFKNVPVLKLANTVADPFGIKVTLQSGITLPAAPAKLTVDPGDKAFEVIERACRSAALLPVSDGKGGLLLTRAGTGRATTELAEGKNILRASGSYDSESVFRTYFVLGQHKGSDELSGPAAASIKAFAEDESVSRVSRSLLIRPEGNVTVEHAKIRAEWERTVRAARAAAVSVTVQGWEQADKSLWPVNALVRVRSPLLELDGVDMLITSVTYELDDTSGTTTELSLKRPDAFNPEPLPPEKTKKGKTLPWQKLENEFRK